MGEKERQETCIFIFNFFDKQYFQMVVPWFVSKALGFSPPFWASWLGSDVGSGSPTDECGESRFFRDWKIEVKEGENFFLGGEEVRCMSCCVFCCCKTLDWLPFFGRNMNMNNYWCFNMFGWIFNNSALQKLCRTVEHICYEYDMHQFLLYSFLFFQDMYVNCKS